MCYSDKQVVADLTVLLQSYDIRHVVACPGSRNAPIVHNMDAAGFRLISVTDERSAGFVALGMTLALRAPVAVCVTSGTALLATLPAAAEAYYRHLPLLVISADRPAYRLGQWEGQTLPQVNALQPYARCFNLEDSGETHRQRHNRLLINQALTSLEEHPGPVHVNVQIEEPLFNFTRTALPDVGRIRCYPAEVVKHVPDELVRMLSDARLPLLVMGQYEEGTLPSVTQLYEQDQLLVLPDVISGQMGSRGRTLVETLLAKDKTWPLGEVRPDVVLHMGGNAVDKHLRLYLRRQKELKVVRIDVEEYADSFDHLSVVLRQHPAVVLEQLAKVLPPNHNVQTARQRLETLLTGLEDYEPATLSDIGVMHHVCRALGQHHWNIHLANSSTIRNATWFLRPDVHRIFANRGTNGIEGSLSTAIGHALATDEPVLLIIGDLSFFYDFNALSIPAFPSNLHIILCNNGGGQIFSRLPGLQESPAFDTYISAANENSAEGIASAFDIMYRRVDNLETLDEAIHATLYPASSQATLLEVCTRDANNRSEWDALLQSIPRNR